MKTRKLLALLLSVAMMLSVVVAFPLESTALDGYDWYRINPNYSTDESQNYGYTHMYPAAAAGSDGVGSGYYNDSAFTYEDIKTYGYFHKAKTPHGIFYLYAENDTVLNLATSYGTNAHESNADYAMLLSVNDADYYIGNGGTLNGTWVNDDVFTNVTLEKGVNVIRLIPTGLFTSGGASWCDLNCINIQQGKGVRALNHSETGVYTYGTSQAEFEALYKNGYSLDGASLGGAWAAGNTYQDLTFANRNDVSNFSITVNAPRDGYYEMEFNMNTGLVGNYGDVAVFVDNVKHHFAYYDFDNILNADNSAFSGLVYMKAGTHVITVTQGLNNKDNGYWFNYGKIKLYGGATVASTQIDPATITDNSTRLYAQDYAYLNNTKLSTNGEACNSDGSKIKGTFYQTDIQNLVGDNHNFQTYADMKLNGLSENTIASYDYSVKAVAAGEYTIAPRLQLGIGNQSLYDTNIAESGYRLIIAVNDDQIYSTYLKSGTIDPTFRVKMIEGVNIVRVILWCGETKWTKYPDDVMWINHEYLRVSEGLSGVTTGMESHLITSGLNFSNYGDNGQYGLNNVGNYMGDGTTAGYLRGSGLTLDNVTYADLATHNVPHFYVTLNAVNSGYYNFTLDITCATNGASGYFNVFVDQTHYKVYYYQAKQWWNKASITVYIPAGNHNLTITNVWGWNGSGVQEADGAAYTDWCDLQYLSTNGGKITKASTTIDPTETVDTYIAKYNTNIMTNVLSDDPAEVTTALQALLDQINNYDGTGKTAEQWDSELSALAASAPTVAATARADAWAVEKAAALAEAESYDAIYPGHLNTDSLVDTAKAAINDLSYNKNSMTYTENLARFDAPLATAKTSIEANLAADEATFATRKTSAVNSLNSRKEADDSAATTAIIDNGIAQINALTYDVALDMTANGQRITPIVSSTTTAAKNQRAEEAAAQLAANKQAVEALKEELAVEVDTSALEGDTAAVEALIAAAKAEVEAYAYDESKTVEENKAAVNAITAALETTLAANRKAVEDQLHVWRQYENGITAESETANVRFIFTLDTTTNDYVDFGFYLTINGVRVQYSFNNCEIDTLGGAYNPIYFDNSDKANKIVYTYITVSNGAFNETVTAEAYFTDANGEHLGAAATANVAKKFNLG